MAAMESGASCIDVCRFHTVSPNTCTPPLYRPRAVIRWTFVRRWRGVGDEVCGIVTHCRSLSLLLVLAIVFTSEEGKHTHIVECALPEVSLPQYAFLLEATFFQHPHRSNIIGERFSLDAIEAKLGKPET